MVLAWFMPAPHSFAQYQYTPIDDPLGTEGTFAIGIDGSNVVGYYIAVSGTPSNIHGFLYNNVSRSFTTLDDPLAGPLGTVATAISGTNIAGYYHDTNGVVYGFVYDGTNYTTVSGTAQTGGPTLYGISGGTFVGCSMDGNTYDGVYGTLGGSLTTLNDPLGTINCMEGIEGSKMVGWYGFVKNGLEYDYGYLYNGSTFTTLNDPMADAPKGAGTYAMGISGSNIVGYYTAKTNHTYGFIYNGKSYATLDNPSASDTYSRGISGDLISGYYISSLDSQYHGFLAIPNSYYEGQYTLLLRTSGTSATIPHGTGYATMTVGRTAGVAMAGALPDGESFSVSGTLISGEFVINKSLSYPSALPRTAEGMLSGTLTLVAETGTSDLNGTLLWIKPTQEKGAYPVGINTNLTVIGSTYTPPVKGGSVLPGFPVEGGTTSGTLTLSDTTGVILTGTSQLTAANQLLISFPPDELKVTITPSTGIFKGSFMYPAAAGGKATPTDFAGVLFQDQVIGGGFFLGPKGSGTVNLMPAQ